MTREGFQPIALSSATLRPWRRGDEASLVRHADNPDVSRNLADVFPSPYTPADADAWIALQAGSPLVTDLAIEVDGAAVGGIGVRPGDGMQRRTGEIGYWLGEPFWGRGIATEAVRAVSAEAFARFDLLRLEAQVYARNAASARVLEKCGYKLEGRLRLRVIKAGEALDVLMYARLRADA